MSNTESAGTTSIGAEPRVRRWFESRSCRFLIWGTILLSAMAVWLGRRIATGGPPALDATVEASITVDETAPSAVVVENVPTTDGIDASDVAPPAPTTDVTEIIHGRHRVGLSEVANATVTVTLTPTSDAESPRFVMLRRGRFPGDVLFSIDGRVPTEEPSTLVGDGLPLVLEDGSEWNGPVLLGEGRWRNGQRVLVPLPDDIDGPITVTLQPLNGLAGPFVLDEVALFAHRERVIQGLQPWSHLFNDFEVYYEILPGLILFTGLLGVFALSRLPVERAQTWGLPFVLAMAASAMTLQLWAAHNPWWGRGLHMTITTGMALEGPGSNLNYGAHMGSNVLQGNGPVVTKGIPPWHRMPGYAYFVAVAGLLAGTSTDIARIGFASALLQAAAFVFAVGWFFHNAARAMPPWVALLTSLLLSLQPCYAMTTQIEGLMPAMAIFLAGAGCRYVAAAASGSPSTWQVLALHAAFATWFVVRPDVVPGWFAVSALLAGRAWWNGEGRLWRSWPVLRHPVVASTLFLTIGLSWAFFKLPMTGEFCMTTNSCGASAVCGLWDVPNQWGYTPSDGMYHQWIAGQGFPVTTSKAAGSFATKETVRFWFTYPVYTVSLLWHELLTFVYHHSHPTLSTMVFPFAPKAYAFVNWILLGVIAASLLTGYRRTQSLLLGWGVLFNMPLFFLLYSSAGRFYNTTTTFLLAATIPLLMDAGFYRHLARRSNLTALVAGTVTFAALFGNTLDHAVMKCNRLRYASPLLDPADSKIVNP